MSLGYLVFEAPQHKPRSKQATPSLILAIFVLTACLANAACTKAPEHPWIARDGLVRIETYHRGELYVKRDHQLGSYDNLLIDHVGFRYGPGQNRLREHHEDRIVSMLLGAVQGSQDGTIGISEVPGPCVLAVNFFVKDLELNPRPLRGESTTNFVSSYGAATMVLELRDSIDQEPLARFVQRRDLGGGSAVQSYSTSLGRLGHVMSFALRDMGNELRRVIPPTRGRQSTTCRGGMSQIALGAR